MRSSRKMVLLALLTSQALVLSIIESWIPIPQMIPGFKLGLANIITLTAIVFFGFGSTLMVVFVRTILASIYTGGYTFFLFSITGGFFSVIVMTILYKRFNKFFSLAGVSIAGAISHNIGQLVVASIIMKDIVVMSYLPFLLGAGIVMGLFVGICSNFLINALKKTGLMS